MVGLSSAVVMMEPSSCGRRTTAGYERISEDTPAGCGEWGSARMRRWSPAGVKTERSDSGTRRAAIL